MGSPAGAHDALRRSAASARPTAPPSVAASILDTADGGTSWTSQAVAHRGRLARRRLLRQPGELRGGRCRRRTSAAPSRPCRPHRRSRRRSLTIGTIGVPYTSSLDASGGLAPYSWAVTGGALPPGLRLAPDGTLSGTPTISGEYSVTFTVTDANLLSSDAVLVISIKPIATPGYWEVASDGGIFSYGGAQFYGSTGSLHLNAPIVGMAATPDDAGLLVAGIRRWDLRLRRRRSSTGRPAACISTRRSWRWRPRQMVPATGSSPPTVGSSPTGTPASTAPPAPSRSTSPSSAWRRPSMASATGSSPPTEGSSPTATPTSTAPPVACRSQKPIVAMTAAPDGGGYWLVASDGGIFSFGDVNYFGSTGGVPLSAPVVGMDRTADGQGYWMVGRDGGIFNYGDAGFFGSAGGLRLNRPVVGMAAIQSLSAGPSPAVDVERGVPARSPELLQQPTRSNRRARWHRDLHHPGHRRSDAQPCSGRCRPTTAPRSAPSRVRRHRR